jgi:hypothetical protein
MKLDLRMKNISLTVLALSLWLAQCAQGAETAAAQASKPENNRGAVPGEIKERARQQETWKVHGNDCVVVYDDPFATGPKEDPEANTLFAICRNGFLEEISGDLDKRAKELDDSFSINFEPEGKPVKVITGKEAALEAMNRESDRYAAHPARKIAFAYPYVQNLNDSAIVTYKCSIVGEGSDPWRSSGFVTNCFVKKDNVWKQVFRSSRWKVLPSEAQSKAGATTGSAPAQKTDVPTPAK